MIPSVSAPHRDGVLGKPLSQHSLLKDLKASATHPRFFLLLLSQAVSLCSRWEVYRQPGYEVEEGQSGWLISGGGALLVTQPDTGDAPAAAPRHWDCSCPSLRPASLLFLLPLLLLLLLHFK